MPSFNTANGNALLQRKRKGFGFGEGRRFNTASGNALLQLIKGLVASIVKDVSIPQAVMPCYNIKNSPIPEKVVEIEKVVFQYRKR